MSTLRILVTTATLAALVMSNAAAVDPAAADRQPTAAHAGNPATTRTVPEVLAGDTWLQHLREDLLPYWEMPVALGTPLGNFPTWRDGLGNLDPGRGKYAASPPSGCLRLQRRLPPHGRRAVPDVRPGRPRVVGGARVRRRTRRLVPRSHRERRPARCGGRQAALRPGVTGSCLRHVLQRHPGPLGGNRTVGCSRPDIPEVSRPSERQVLRRPLRQHEPGRRHRQQRRRHRQHAGAGDSPAVTERGPADRPRTAGTVP